VAGKRLAPLRRGRAVSPPEAPKWSMGEPGMVPEIHHVRMQRYGGVTHFQVIKRERCPLCP